MAKVIDITEKLNFEENPKLKIYEGEYEVNCDAPTMLKIMQLLGDGTKVTPDSVIQMYDLIFSSAERKKLEKLKLCFPDFQTVVMEAVNLVSGSGEEPGE